MEHRVLLPVLSNQPEAKINLPDWPGGVGTLKGFMITVLRILKRLFLIGLQETALCQLAGFGGGVFVFKLNCLKTN